MARLSDLADGKALLKLLEPHVKRVGGAFDGLASGEARTLGPKTPITCVELSALGFGEIDRG